MRTRKSCAWLLCLVVNKIDYFLKQTSWMEKFISQCDRPLNRQEYEDDKTQIEQGGKLKNETLEECYILSV